MVSGTIFDPKAYRAYYLKKRGISETDVALMGIAERNALEDTIEAEREAEVYDFERQLNYDL